MAGTARRFLWRPTVVFACQMPLKNTFIINESNDSSEKDLNYYLQTDCNEFFVKPFAIILVKIILIILLEIISIRLNPLDPMRPHAPD